LDGLIEPGCNRFVVDGKLVELESLRTTPAGVARIALKIRNVSTQQEAGMPRQVSVKSLLWHSVQQRNRQAPCKSGSV